jgi:biotin carboxyl carrier protein
VSASNPAVVRPLGAGRFRVSDGQRQRVGYAIARGAETWVFLDGVTYLVRESRSGAARRGAGADDQTALASPMPATVASVNVTPGQQVAPGDVLVMLEAMKMELPIKAPRAGVVKAVMCRPGDLVQPGVPLVELE